MIKNNQDQKTDVEGILEIARELADTVVAENADRTDEHCVWPEEEMQQILGSGLGGLVIPVEFGGLGQGLSTMTQVCEILGRENASVGICLGMHYSAAAVLASRATEYQVETYLKPICAGKHLTTLALTELGTGIHFYYPQCQLKKHEDAFILNGDKSFITNGTHADSYVISTQGGEEDIGDNLMSMWVLDKDSPGMSWGPPWAGFGMRGNSSRNLQLEDVSIKAGNLLGVEGDQIWFVVNVVAPYFLSAMTGSYLGAATHAFNIAENKLKRRVHSHTGRSISEDSIMQHKFAKLWVELERTRQYVRWATKQYDNQSKDALHAVLCTKALVGDTATHVVNEAMTFCGGTAYGKDRKLQRLLRDIRACHVMSPTTDILYKWAGRSLLGEPLLSDW